MNIRYPIYEGVYRILTVTSGSPKHSVQIMTGTGSGYIGNGCVLNPFAGITLLYLHDSFPFIEAYSVPHCTPANQPESNPLITP